MDVKRFKAEALVEFGRDVLVQAGFPEKQAHAAAMELISGEAVVADPTADEAATPLLAFPTGKLGTGEADESAPTDGPPTEEPDQPPAEESVDVEPPPDEPTDEPADDRP